MRFKSRGRGLAREVDRPGSSRSRAARTVGRSLGLESLEPRVLLSLGLFVPHVRAIERLVAFDQGPASLVSPVAALGQAQASADFNIAIDAGATLPWVMMQTGQQPMIEGVGPPVFLPVASFGAIDVTGAANTGGGAPVVSGALSDSPSPGPVWTSPSIVWPSTSLSFGPTTEAASVPASGFAPIVSQDSGTNTPAIDSSPAPDVPDPLGVVLPLGPMATYASTLNAQTPSEWIHITPQVDSGSYTISLQSGVDTTGGVHRAALSAIMYLDSKGDLLAQATPEMSSSGDTGQQSVTISIQSSQAGGQLAVQVSTSPSLSSSGTGKSGSATAPTAADSAGSSVPFSLTVQQQTLQTAAVAVTDVLTPGGYSTGLLALASTAVTSLGSVPFSSGDLAMIADPAAISQDPAISQAISMSPSTEPSVASDGWLPTGPLVSRSAGPLGLVLAMVSDDVTTGVDRAERAFAEDPDAAEPAIEQIVGRGVDSWLADQTDFPNLAPGDRPGSSVVVAIERGGGMPLYVSSASHRAPGDLALLLAGTTRTVEVVQSPTQLAAPSFIGANTDLATAPDRPQSQEEHRRAAGDVIRAALGLVVGLSLTTAPLFSDLLAQVRSNSKRRLGRLASPNAGGKPRPRTPRFARWLADLFA